MYTIIRGEQVFYSVGNGHFSKEQPSVVFIHGAGMDHSVWVLPARYFARHGYNVIAADLPGHGRSKGSAIDSVSEIADWISELMSALAISEAAIVGHSMGSLIAINFAAHYPEQTRALALLGTSTPMPVTEMLLDAAQDNSHDAFDMVNTWSHSASGQMGGNENPGISMTVSGMRLLERSGDKVLFTDLSACNNFVDGASLAERITAPTLIIAGRQDRMTAAVNAGKLSQIIKTSRLEILDPCGHFMLSEQPNTVLDLLATIV